jgi:glutamate-1-semialdehyde 2,1-aminomutase
MGRPGAYEHLERITSRLVKEIVEAGRAAGHEMCGGNISGELQC